MFNEEKKNAINWCLLWGDSHADGTVKFWDSSSLSLQVLYRLKTAKVFEKARAKTLRSDSESAMSVEPSKQHLAIQQMAMCPDNRLLTVAGASGHVMLFKFRRQESNLETTVMEFFFLIFFF